MWYTARATASLVGVSEGWRDVDECTGGSVGASEDRRDVNECTGKSEVQGTGGKARSVGASEGRRDVDEHTGGSVGASEDWRDLDERTGKIASPEQSHCESASVTESWPVVLGFEWIPRVLHTSSESA